MGLKLSKATIENMLPSASMFNLTEDELFNKEFTFKKELMPRPQAGKNFKIDLAGTSEVSGEDNGRVSLLFTGPTGKRVRIGIRGLLFVDVVEKGKVAKFKDNYGIKGKQTAQQTKNREAELKELHDFLVTDAGNTDDSSQLELPTKIKIVDVEPVMHNATTKKWPFYMYSTWKTKSAGKTPAEITELFQNFEDMQLMYDTGENGLADRYKKDADKNYNKKIVISLVE